LPIRPRWEDSWARHQLIEQEDADLVNDLGQEVSTFNNMAMRNRRAKAAEFIFFAVHGRSQTGRSSLTQRLPPRCGAVLRTAKNQTFSKGVLSLRRTFASVHFVVATAHGAKG